MNATDFLLQFRKLLVNINQDTTIKTEEIGTEIVGIEYDEKENIIYIKTDLEDED